MQRPGQAVSRDGLMDTLRRLEREQWHNCGGQHFRLGLAQCEWQLAQAGELIRRQQGPGWQAPDAATREARDAAVVLALGVAPQPRSPQQTDELWTLGTVSLRRDSLDGVLIDPRYEDALLNLATPASRLVSLHGLALAPSMFYAQVLEAMLDMVALIAIDEWGATDLLVSCDSRLAALYCQALGFTRCAPPAGQGEPEAVLLHMPAAQLRCEPERWRIASNDAAVADPVFAATRARHNARSLSLTL